MASGEKDHLLPHLFLFGPDPFSSSFWLFVMQSGKKKALCSFPFPLPDRVCLPLLFFALGRGRGGQGNVINEESNLAIRRGQTVKVGGWQRERGTSGISPRDISAVAYSQEPIWVMSGEAAASFQSSSSLSYLHVPIVGLNTH